MACRLRRPRADGHTQPGACAGTSWRADHDRRDCLGSSIGTVGLEPFHGDRSLSLCGTALTVRVRPGDNLMIHKALTLAEPGDVIVVDGSGELSHALVGGLMRLAALARGVVGFVLDGALR
ncbi:MAG: hypothetical protein H0W16_05310, partial [Actinobacteria bacterium]|nr:hypothetical protein [Actinomycetota bacterium]